MTRPLPRIALAGLGAALALSLSGCFGSIDTTGAVSVDPDAPATIAASELATVAEGIVLEQGFTVEIDCGMGDVPFEVGSSIECAGVDPATGEAGTYTLTISSIDGTDYVLDVAGSAAEPEPQPESAFESAAAFADLTAEAITSSLGERPVVDCGTEDIEIFVGQEVRCYYETSANAAFIIVTVTEFDGASYAIEVREE